MKEIKVIQLRNRVKELENAVGNMYQQLVYQQTLNTAMANVMKQLPGYDEAIRLEKLRLESEKDTQNQKVPNGADTADNSTAQEQSEVQPEDKAPKGPKLDLDIEE